jgi:hypothetical protein
MLKMLEENNSADISRYIARQESNKPWKVTRWYWWIEPFRLNRDGIPFQRATPRCK